MRAGTNVMQACHTSPAQRRAGCSSHQSRRGQHGIRRQAPTPVHEPPCMQGPGIRVLISHCQRTPGRPSRRPVLCLATASPEDSSPGDQAGVTAAPKPWSEEDLAQLSAYVAAQEEQELGTQWRSLFMDDPLHHLFEYAFEDFQRWAQLQERMDHTPGDQWETAGVLPGAIQYSPALVNEFIGLGTWRLRGILPSPIAFLVQRIEGTWREMFTHDLCVYPRDQWKGQYDICDSLDPDRELKGWSYADIPAPDKGQEGYPRLVLENRVYHTNVFRKLHIEVGARQDGLEVLHCVLYPRYNYDLPILGMDLVCAKGRVTLAIIDACPVSKDLSLPSYYLQTMEDLQSVFFGEEAAQNRTIPEWGTNIFSKACVCITPDTPEKLTRFLAYASALHRAHCMLAPLLLPINKNDPANQARLQELLDGHKRFVDNQLANKKTSRVLEAAFGAEWTEQYMTRMMFDYCPGDEPPLERDSTYVQLYQYFDSNPELGDAGMELANLEVQVAVQRAEEVLDQLVRGVPVRQDKAEAALATLFDKDPQFQSDCLMVLPELGDMAPSAVGALLLGHLEELGLADTAVKRWTDPALGTGGDKEQEPAATPA